MHTFVDASENVIAFIQCIRIGLFEWTNTSIFSYSSSKIGCYSKLNPYPTH